MLNQTLLLQQLELQVRYKLSNLSFFIFFIGCGKSSVMKLIERFYDPAEGHLLYNDIDLKDIDSKWFH